MTRKLDWRLVFAAALIALVAALALACGGDDDDGSDDDNGDTASATTSGSGNSSGDAAGACPALPYTIALKAARGATIGNDDQSFRVTSSRAVSLAGGAGYTIYLANYDIPDGEVGGLAAPVPPGGKTLITVFLTTFNAQGTPAIIKTGDDIAYTNEFNKLTFRVITQVGKESFNANSAAKGSFKVTSTGDRVCGEIDYIDSATSDLSAVQNQVKGLIGADVKK